MNKTRRRSLERVEAIIAELITVLDAEGAMEHETTAQAFIADAVDSMYVAIHKLNEARRGPDLS